MTLPQTSKTIVNPNKTISVRELGAVDVEKLISVVEGLSQEVWRLDNQTKPNKFEVLNTTEHIVMRFVKDLNDFTQSYDRPMWGILKKHVESVLLEAVKPYAYKNGTFPRVMFAKLLAGKDIERHIDGSDAAVFPHKIHIPLVTNEQSFFYVNDVQYCFKKGYAYEVNNLASHSAVNHGETDRIHLIFEYYNTDFEYA